MEIEIEPVLDKKTFSKRIEDLVQAKSMPYMDAIIQCSDDIGLEYETSAKLINKTIKEKLEVEAQSLNLMQKCDRLPV